MFHLPLAVPTGKTLIYKTLKSFCAGFQSPESTPVYELTSVDAKSNTTASTRIQLRLCMMVRDEDLRESYLVSFRQTAGTDDSDPG